MSVRFLKRSRPASPSACTALISDHRRTQSKLCMSKSKWKSSVCAPFEGWHRGKRGWEMRNQNEPVCCFYGCTQFFMPQDGDLEIAFCETAQWIQIKQWVNVSSSPPIKVILPTPQGRLLNGHLSSRGIFCLCNKMAEGKPPHSHSLSIFGLFDQTIS